MAYNLLAQATENLDWGTVNDKLSDYIDCGIEFSPINLGNKDNCGLLAISLPMSKISSEILEKIKDIISLLAEELEFDIYDLHTGKALDVCVLEENLFS